MKIPLCSRYLFPSLVSVALAFPTLPMWAAAPSPEIAAERFGAAQARTSARVSTAVLQVETEMSYTLRFSERPGGRELVTRSLDPTRLARSPRPPFWWPEARVHWGEFLWDGRIESFGDDEPVSLLDPDRYRLARTEELDARGRDALRLVFEGTGGRDRVTVTVDRGTFEPFTVEQVLLRPVGVDGARLTDYRATFSVASRAGFWLVAQGEESYRFSTSAGERQVAHSWKPLSWLERSPARRAGL
jgi:hypothetical protein